MRGLAANFDAINLRLRTASPSPKIIALNETFINPSIHDLSAYAISGYDCYRVDRLWHGGGTAVYIHHSLPAVLLSSTSSQNFEIIWVKINSSGSQIVVGVVYNSNQHNRDIFDQLTTDLTAHLQRFRTAKFLIVGDLNMHHPDWLPYTNHRSASGVAGLQFATEFGLSQLVPCCTRSVQNSDGTMCENLLDVALTDDCGTFSFVGLDPPLGTSDHSVVTLRVSCSIEISHVISQRKVWLFKRGNWSALNKQLAEIDWSIILQLPVDHCWNRFSAVICEAMNQHIPSRVVNAADRTSPWFDSNCRLLSREKRALWNLWRMTGTVDAFVKYKQTRNRLSAAIRKAKIMHCNKVAEKVDSSDSSVWWKLVNTILGRARKPRIPSLMSQTSTVSDPTECSELFNKIFVEMSTLADPFRKASKLPIRSSLILNNVKFEENVIADLLRSLKTKKATGPDGIPASVLKATATCLANPLSKLFTRFFEASFVPYQWRVSQVVPIHKKRSRSDPKNYRPVSLLPIIGKIMEKVIASKIRMHLEDEEILSNAQFGFRRQHSCLHPILILLHDCYKALDSGQVMHVVSLDINSAFLRVWHNGLISKCESCGIGGLLLSWLKEYLNKREQIVVVNGSNSRAKSLYAGVPQGSVLGPLLFQIFINDLPESVDCRILMFADDITICSSSLASIERNLIHIALWATKWQVEFSLEKTQYMVVSNKTSPSSTFSIRFNDSVIHPTDRLKTLGFTLTSNLSWTPHLFNKIKMASMRSGMLRRAGLSLSPSAKCHLYKTLIRPIIEYGSPAMTNISKDLQNCLEKFQRRVLRTSFYNGTPLDSLAHRRKVALVQILHQIIQRSSPELVVKTFKLVPRTFARPLRSTAASHGMEYEIPGGFRSSLRFESSFVPLALRIWNALPKSIVEVKSPCIFRRLLHEHFKSLDV